MNLGKSCIRINISLMKNCTDLNPGEALKLFTPEHFPDCGLFERFS